MLSCALSRRGTLASNRGSNCTKISVAAVRQGRGARGTLSIKAEAVAPGAEVVVAGSTGGVGQILTAKLLKRGYKVRALTRSKAKAEKLFGCDTPNLQIVELDLRDAAAVRAAAPTALDGAAAVFCATGTTAFPSSRWEGGNGPRPTDYVSTANLIAAVPKGVKRFVFVTSAGVERQGQLPWAILNTFGVLKYKRDSEVALEKSGLPFTVLRPGRLTDGPYTSFDLNTLLQATAGSRQAVTLSPRDDLAGETSRIAVAEAALQAAATDATLNKYLSIASVEGDGPGEDAAGWQRLFAACK